jgi:hypothetical protein
MLNNIKGDTLDSEKKLVIEEITEKLTPYRNLIHLFGIFGGLKHDIDTIIILKGDKNNPCNFKNLKTIISVFENLPDKFKAQFPLSVFPSFRLQTWAEISSLPPDGPLIPRSHQSIHLLIYPDEKRLIAWEKPLFVITLLDTLRHIWGDSHKIRELINSLEFSPLRQRLEYYINLMYETYQLLAISHIPEQALMAEVFNKLIYILKFSSLEYLHGKGIMPNPPYELKEIKDTLHSFPDLLPSALFDHLGKCEKQEIFPGNGELFYQLSEFLNGLVISSDKGITLK